MTWSDERGGGKAVFYFSFIKENVLILSIFLLQVAPMKALCSERFTDWSTKFEPFGLKCKEVTGDSELDDYYELQNVHIIMTTPVSLMLFQNKNFKIS